MESIVGDGHDWDIWYSGMVIGNCKAMTKRKATNLARKLYTGGDAIIVTPCLSNPFYTAPVNQK